MAKKIVISDLVLKLSLDSQKAISGLSKLDRVTKSRNTSEIKSEKSKLKLSERRLQSAKAHLAGSSAFHKLRKISGKEALGFERKLKKAYLDNDKVQINKTKRDIRENLQAHKARLANIARTNKVEKSGALSLAKARVTSAKAYAARSSNLQTLKEISGKEGLELERQLKKAYLDNDKVQVNRTKHRIDQQVKAHKSSLRNIADIEKKEAQANRNRVSASKRQASLDKRLHNQKRRDTKWMAKRVGGFGAMPIGAMAGVGVGAGVAGTVATQQMLGFRRAEMAFRASMNVSGSKSDQEAMFEQIQRNADYYNVNRAMHLQAFASSRAAIPSSKMGDQDLLAGLQGMAVTAAVTGTTPAALDKAQYGLQQILTSGIQAQEIRQITENMATAAPAVYKAIGQLTGTEVTGMGEVRTLAEQGALSGVDPVDFYKVFTGILNSTYKEEFEKYRNSLPQVFDRMSKRIHIGVLTFAEGFDTDIKAIFNDITYFIETHQETIRSWGEVFGTVMTKIWAILKAIGSKLEPYLESISDYAKDLDPNAVADFMGNLIKLGLILKGASLLGGLALFIGKMEKMVGILKSAGLISAVTGAPAVATAGNVAAKGLGFTTMAGAMGGWLPQLAIASSMSAIMDAGLNNIRSDSEYKINSLLGSASLGQIHDSVGGSVGLSGTTGGNIGHTFHIGEVNLPYVPDVQAFSDELIGTAMSY